MSRREVSFKPTRVGESPPRRPRFRRSGEKRPIRSAKGVARVEVSNACARLLDFAEGQKNRSGDLIGHIYRCTGPFSSEFDRDRERVEKPGIFESLVKVLNAEHIVVTAAAAGAVREDGVFPLLAGVPASASASAFGVHSVVAREGFRARRR